MPNQKTEILKSILLNFRAKCQDCVWNKEESANANCQTCLTDNISYLLQVLKEKWPEEREPSDYVQVKEKL